MYHSIRVAIAIILSTGALIYFNMGAAYAAEQRQALNLAAGWVNYLATHAPANVIKDGNSITVSGLIKNGKFGVLATLPKGMRPAQRLIFNLNTHDRTARVDVLPNGQIRFVEGNKVHRWVSLDGISFVLGRGTAQKLASGWQNFGNGFAGFNATLIGDTVVVGGLVKGRANNNVIATLPPGLRPAKSHIFNLNSHDKTSRVDVRPDGKIVSVYRAPKRNWVSLNGVTFLRKQGQVLATVNGWHNYGGEYSTANVTRIGNRVSVSGLIKGSKWGHVATLPAGMCPANRHIFNLNNHDHVARVDVFPNCQITWIGGGKNHGWINLDGIAFYRGNSAGVPATSSIKPKNKFSMLSGAGRLISSLNVPHLKNNWNRWGNKFRQEGELLTLDMRIANQPATIIIYRPKGRKNLTDKPNVAVLTNNFKISNLIGDTNDTVADDLQVNRVTYIFVPKGNEQNINTNELPRRVRQQVEFVRTGPISLVSGNNMFGIANARDGGTTANFLKQIGMPLGNLKVNAAYGRKKSKVTGRTDPYKAVRLTRAGIWNEPFKLKNTKMTNPTLEYTKLGNFKTVRGWGTGTLKNKSYFIFLQKRGSKGPFPTAAALDAKTITLKDYKDAALVLGETVFGSYRHVQTLLNGIDRLPLDQVLIENPRYRAGSTTDHDNNPIFTNVLIKGASKFDKLPGENKAGPVMWVRGNGKVFGHTAGKVEGWIKNANKKGMDFKATVRLPSVGGATLGEFDLDVYKVGNKYAMAFKGKAKVIIKDTTVINEKIAMKLSNRRFVYSVDTNCLRPVGFDISIGANVSLKPKNFRNPEKCIADIGGAIKNAAGEVAVVSRAQYNKAMKEVEAQLKNIGDKAEEAAKYAANKFSSAFGFRSGKSDPPKLSIKDQFKLQCGAGKSLGPSTVMWRNECHLNLAYRKGSRQSSTAPELSTKCLTTNWTIIGGNKTPLPVWKTCKVTRDARAGNDGLLKTVSTTKSQKNPWWQIDLGRVLPVSSIALYPSIRDVELNGVIVAVSETISDGRLMWDGSGMVQRYKLKSGAMAIVSSKLATKMVKSRNVSKFGIKNLTINIPRPIRYIRVYRPGYGTIALGDVQVFGPRGIIR